MAPKLHSSGRESLHIRGWNKAKLQLKGNMIQFWAQSQAFSFYVEIEKEKTKQNKTSPPGFKL